MKHIWFSLGAALVLTTGLWPAAFAAEIAFIGGSGNDLSVAANWEGGALPSTNDTGVVDYATFTGGAAAYSQGRVTIRRNSGLLIFIR